MKQSSARNPSKFCGHMYVQLWYTIGSNVYLYIEKLQYRTPLQSYVLACVVFMDTLGDCSYTLLPKLAGKSLHPVNELYGDIESCV